MLKRFRQMHISLAGKCQLLFGSAVLLIIAAALFVVWTRMEQLTDQPSERAARTLTDYIMDDHVLWQTARSPSAATLPTGAPSVPGTTSTSQGLSNDEPPFAAMLAQPRSDFHSAPTTLPLGDESRDLIAVRLMLTRHTPVPLKLNKFDERAMARFAKDPDTEVYFRTEDNRSGRSTFHYARQLRAKPACLACHAGDVAPLGPAAPGSPGGPTTRPVPMLGMISIDMHSQVEPGQILLNRIFVLTAGAVAGTLAIIVFYLITTRLILQPVRVLQETAEKVAKGDLNIRSDINTGDEFQQLARSFNTMLSNLKESQDQLRAINKSLDMKLEQLAESNVALYESNRLKSEFLANVSHELRTPLTSILGFAELVRDMPAAGTDAKAVRYLQNILTSGRRLLDLINDLLDLAKIEAGRMEVRAEPLSLQDLFEGLTSIIKPLAEKSEVTVTDSVATDVPILYTDAAKLQQILYNFLSNAIKFSPSPGRIDLKAERQGDSQVKISVADQGPGIEPEQQEVIFEKFRQIDGSATRAHEGTGLGLAISRELVTLLGGSIGVISTPGQGATFWIVVPVKIQSSAHDLHNRGQATAAVNNQLPTAP